MVRPVMAMEQLLFLDREGQVMVRYYGLYANAHRGKVRKADRVPVLLGMIEEEPRPGHVFEQVALMAALMEAMRTARLPLRPVLMETCERHHECGRGERGLRIAGDVEREGGELVLPRKSRHPVKSGLPH